MKKHVLFFLLLLNVGSAIANTQVTPWSQGSVVSSHPLATLVGEKILAQGGNAVDAAVAVGYALAVVHPCCGNLGGGGFMLLRLKDGKTLFLDFREQAPFNLTPKDYLDDHGQPDQGKILKSYAGVGTPGTVLGLNTALKIYGNLPLSQVIQPAYDLAHQGYKLRARDAELLMRQGNNRFYRKDELLRQPDLAKSLESIAKLGSKSFYHGPVRHLILASSKKHHGVFSKKDFDNYEVREYPAISCDYRGYKIYSAAPPSSGGVTLCEILQITRAYPLKKYGYRSAEAIHDSVEAMRYAYSDRNHYLGDPAFVVNPIARLLSPAHIDSIRKKILPGKAGKSGEIADATAEKMETTHYGVVDNQGNAVAVTYSLNGFFGSGIMPKGTGFYLNNTLADFALKHGAENIYQLVQGEANLIAPGKRPLSSMSPTIVTKDGKLVMVLGAAGGSTIITIVLQMIQDVIDFDMTLPQAIAAPRIHMQWLPDKIFAEPGAISDDVKKKLEAMGYQITLGSPFRTRRWGDANAIYVDARNQTYIAATDPRRRIQREVKY